MAIRKTTEDMFVVTGQREQWFSRCKDALGKGKFSGIEANSTLYQIKGAFKTFTVWGNIEVTLLPDGDSTKIVAKATANVDNIYALFKSPGKAILDAFKGNLV